VEITGTVVQVMPVEEFRGGELKKQTFVVEIVDGKYTSHLAIDQWNDKITQLAPGQTVGVKCNVRSKQGKGHHAARWFTNVSAWSTSVEQSNVVEQAKEQLDAVPFNDDDGLPF
tara:strand:+ start:247 stop:588 length:342 start_codon:yes stop_codon:yes gene_type:complete